MAQPVDLLVDGGVLLDIGIGNGDIGLGLVEIVVRDEVVHRRVREELLELLGELGGERFIVRDDESRFPYLSDRIGHGKGLPRAGDPEERLEAFVLPEPVGEALDSLGLVPCWRPCRREFEWVCHRNCSSLGPHAIG